LSIRPDAVELSHTLINALQLLKIFEHTRNMPLPAIAGDVALTEPESENVNPFTSRYFPLPAMVRAFTPDNVMVVVPAPYAEAPCNRIPLLTVTELAPQEADPEGIRTVSPSLAELMADCTFADEALAAEMVAPKDWPVRPKVKRMKTSCLNSVFVWLHRNMVFIISTISTIRLPWFPLGVS
jgi:hypothetical protein